MASAVYNEGAHRLTPGVTGSISWSSDTIKILLVTSSYTLDKDHDFVNDVTASEVNPTNYSRKTLASKTITKDNATDRVKFDAADPVWTSLGGASNATIAAAIVYKEVTDDTDSPLICKIDLISSFTTNGSDFTFQFDANGLFYSQQ